MKKPKDMTMEELRDLHLGLHSYVDEPCTDPEKLKIGIRTVRRFTCKPVKLSVLNEDDIICVNIDGIPHVFGEFADGTYYRQPIW